MATIKIITNKIDLTNVEIDKPFEEITCQDILSIIDEKIPDTDGLLIENWVDMSNPAKNPLNNVTTSNLDLALRMVGITFDHGTIDKIIDLVELIATKGDETSMRDISKLKASWK